MSTLSSLCSDYILLRDLRESSADQMHRIVGVFNSWQHRDVPVEDFTERLVSEFLLSKQQAGLSSYYRKSLRNGLVALLRFAGKSGTVRPVKTHELEPASWSPEEVRRLIDACAMLRTERRRKFWMTLIAVAYYTGLSYSDLRTLNRADFSNDGIVRLRRSKTGRRVVASIPLEVLDSLPEGPLWPHKTTDEAFRQTFRRLVRFAGLSGSFKKLRKTAGTLVDREHPGRGHELLANNRAIFERHYRDWSDRQNAPLRPPTLPDGPDRAA